MLKKSTLLFMSVFLLLAFSVNSVEAAPCGDGKCKGKEDAGNCPADCMLGGGDGDATYSVDIFGAVSYDMGAAPWLERPGGKSIRIAQPHNWLPDPLDIGVLNLSFFDKLLFPNGTEGANCFEAASVPLWGQGYIQRGRGGRADGVFWFMACTNQGTVAPGGVCFTEVLYLLKMFGQFDDLENWTPAPGMTTRLTMTDWEMRVDGGDDTVKNISCIGGGLFDDPNTEIIEKVFIDVERIP